MKRNEEYYLALDHFLDEAKAGAPDAWLSERSGAPIPVIAKWRKHSGIKRPSVPAQDQFWALQGLAQSYDPKMHVVGSDLSGLWEPPTYLIREPMNYSLFCRAVHTLSTDLGMSDSQISSALGVRERDVLLARQAQRSFLQRRGRKCVACETITDPAFGPYCSSRCHADATRLDDTSGPSTARAPRRPR